MPAKAIRIFLLRHGESEANLDKRVNARLSVQLIEGRPGGGYVDRLVFDGFPPPDTRQTRREEGVVSGRE
jgi:hypothetical protein